MYVSKNIQNHSSNAVVNNSGHTTNLGKGANVGFLIEQQLSNFELVLPGGDVQRSVSILRQHTCN